MIGALLLLAAQGLAPVADPGPETDPIVVIGQRLQAIEVHVGRGPDGKWYCGMDGSTGRLSLDKRLCKAVTTCVRKGAVSDADVEQCVATTKQGLLRKLERKRARQ
jgi:hypothetical protein